MSMQFTVLYRNQRRRNTLAALVKNVYGP